MTFYVAIVGSRDFDDQEFLFQKMDELLRETNDNEIVIVSGGARGADYHAKQYAKARKLKYKEYFAMWDNVKGKPAHEIGRHKTGEKYWKMAGYARNLQIIERADIIIAFWDGKSPGTAHTISEARKAGKPVEIVAV